MLQSESDYRLETGDDGGDEGLRWRLHGMVEFFDDGPDEDKRSLRSRR